MARAVGVFAWALLLAACAPEAADEASYPEAEADIPAAEYTTATEAPGVQQDGADSSATVAQGGGGAGTSQPCTRPPDYYQPGINGAPGTWMPGVSLCGSIPLPPTPQLTATPMAAMPAAARAGESRATDPQVLQPAPRRAEDP